MRVVGRYGFAEAGFHFRCHPAGLQLAEHDPAADFIQQYGLDASMQRIQPPLILRTRLPDAHHLVTVLIKLHSHTGFIVGRATETVVALHIFPRIDNLLHIVFFFIWF